jgi:hypothetical protein
MVVFSPWRPGDPDFSQLFVLGATERARARCTNGIPVEGEMIALRRRLADAVFD